MPKKTVKRCIRTQCMKIYEETEKNKFCACGALLQNIEIDIKPKKNMYKKTDNVPKTKLNPLPEKLGDDTKAFLYLLLDNEDVKFELSDITRIGRASDGVQVDIDLSEYAGKDISREHAVIRKEKEGYYITNVSRNHSVRLMDHEGNGVALEYGKKVLLNAGNGIILSKKILLAFEEKE